MILSYLKCFGAIELYEFVVYHGPKIAIAAADLYLVDTKRNYGMVCGMKSSALRALLKQISCFIWIYFYLCFSCANVEFLLSLSFGRDY